MSFVFELRLTMPQIQILVAFIKMAEKQQVDKLPKGTSISSTRALVADGLLEVKLGKNPTLDKAKWKVTPKGYMVANLIREEMKLVNEVPKLTDLSRLYWYHMPPEIEDQTGINGRESSGTVEARL